jgi:hypothetical protein
VHTLAPAADLVAGHGLYLSNNKAHKLVK